MAHIAAIADFLANGNMEELRRKEVIIKLVKNYNDAQNSSERVMVACLFSERGDSVQTA